MPLLTPSTEGTGGNTMKRLHKAAAILFAAALLCSFSVFAYAAEDDWGDEWETEEISAAEAQENSHQSAEPEKSNSVPESSASQNVSLTDTLVSETNADNVSTGDNTAAGVFAFAGAAAVSAVIVGVTVRRRKKTI